MNVLNLLFGFGSFYFLVRMLDKELFGIWALFVATTSIFEMARNGLIQNALIKYLSHSSTEESPEILSASFSLSAIIMACCILINIALAGYLAHLWHYPGLAKMFYAYSVVYLLQGALSQLQWIEQANLSFVGILISSAIRQGGFFIYVLVCFIFHYPTSLMTLIFVQAIAVCTAAVTEYFFVRKHLMFSFRIHVGWIKKLFNYGKFVFGTAISSILANTINQMMLGALLSPAAAGAFNVAGRIISLVDQPTTALAAIVFPQSAKRFATQGNEAIKYLFEKSVGTTLALLIPCLLVPIFFPGFVVRIIAGNNYPETIPIIQLTALVCLFNPYDLMFGTIMDSIGKPKLNFVILLLFTILKLTLNFVLIEQYGIMGAVYATLIADVVIFVVKVFFLKKELNIRLLNTLIYAQRFYPEFFSNYIRPVLKRQN